MDTLNLKHNLIKFQSIIALLFMCIALSFLSDRFLSADNAWNVMRQISVNMIISVGMTLVILTGGITEAYAADKLIEEEKADLIGVGRAIYKDSDWAKKAIESLK